MSSRSIQLLRTLSNGLSFNHQEILPAIQTNWVVITGAPGSGKSTICQRLEERGFAIVPEMSRIVIEQALKVGFSIDEIMQNPELLTNAVLIRNLDRAKHFTHQVPLIWDTGIFDSAAFYQVAGVDYSDRVRLLTKYHYKGVIFLEMLHQNDLSEDNARPQTARLRENIDYALRQSYYQAGYTLSYIPVTEIDNRVEKVQSAINTILQSENT